MTLEELKGKKIAVLGLGVEGVSTAQYLAKKSIAVTVLEKKEEKDCDKETVANLRKNDVHCIFGADYLSHVSAFDIVVRSPGIKRNLPEIIQAQAKGTVITSQTQLFFDFCPSEIIGVTGTKGKGTTSALICEMLRKSFPNAEDKHAYLGGNIGVPSFEFLDNVKPQDKVVLELSSFQLEDLTDSPHIAVLLMITSEHLGADTKGTQNYHESLEEYIDAKRNILRFQSKEDFAVINRDYPASNESDVLTDGKVFQVSREREVADNGCFVKDGAVWVRRDSSEEKILDVTDILLPGAHNLENVCAAAMAAMLSGVSKEHIKEVLKTFKGLEHRLERVATVGGVTYFDDSFSTTPETAIAAILAFKEPEVIILGGSKKGSDFKELGRIIAKAENIRAIIGIGVEWERIKEEILEHTDKVFMVEGARDMATIVAAAAKIAQSGDVVLLSPACASFDMFTNYKERGNVFKEEVRKLQK